MYIYVYTRMHVKEYYVKQSQVPVSWLFTSGPQSITVSASAWVLPIIGKDPDAGKDWRQKERQAAEDEMIRWHHRLDGPGFEQTPGGREGQGNLAAAVHEVAKSRTWLNNSSKSQMPEYFLYVVSSRRSKTSQVNLWWKNSEHCSLGRGLIGKRKFSGVMNYFVSW